MTIVVGVGLGNGVCLRLFRLVDAVENTPMGGRPIKKAEQIGEPLTLAGNGQALLEHDVRSPRTWGYRLHTLTGEKEQFFRQWLDQQTKAKDSWLLQSKAVIWHDTADNVEDEAVDLVERQGLKDQFAPIDPDDLPPELRGRRLDSTAEDQRVQPARRDPQPFIHHKLERQRRRQTANGTNNRNENGRIIRTKQE
jgi:hypothetical protein